MLDQLLDLTADKGIFSHRLVVWLSGLPGCVSLLSCSAVVLHSSRYCLRQGPQFYWRKVAFSQEAELAGLGLCASLSREILVLHEAAPDIIRELLGLCVRSGCLIKYDRSIPAASFSVLRTH